MEFLKKFVILRKRLGIKFPVRQQVSTLEWYYKAGGYWHSFSESSCMVAEKLFPVHSINVIRNRLVKANESLAIAESVTGGLLQHAFSSATDASLFYQGGMTAYNAGQKSMHLGIDPIKARASNCVSPEIADQMALQICKSFHSNWGIAVTGYASPVPEGGKKLYAFYSIVRNGTVVISKRLEHKRDKVIQVQIDYVHSIVEDFRAYLE